MRTRQEYTFKTMDRYVNDKAYLYSQLEINLLNDFRNYQNLLNKRIKDINVARYTLINMINNDLKINYSNDYYATTKQIIKYDNEHNNIFTRALYKLEKTIIKERNDD